MKKLFSFFSDTFKRLNLFVPARKEIQEKPQASHTQRVAVVISHHENAWELEIAQRFISTLRDLFGMRFVPDVDIVSAQNSSKRLRETFIPTLINQISDAPPYIAVVTVNGWVSQVIRDQFDLCGIKIPQIFVAVDDPVALGLVDCLEYPGCDVTGVTSVPDDCSRQLKNMHAVVPGMKKILLICDSYSNSSGETHTQYRRRFLAASEQAGYHTNVCIIADGSLWQQQEAINNAFSQDSYDVICVARDSYTLCHIPLISQLCVDKNIPLCSAELTSVAHGAAFGFGERGSAYGPYAARVVYDVLVNGRPIKETPVVSLTYQPRMCFNYEVLIQQGIVLSENAHALLSMHSIFHD